MGLLNQVFLITTLRPWHTNAIKRIVKTPKLHFIDTGLLASSRALTVDRVKASRTVFGPVLENFVYSEISKLIAGSRTHIEVYHFRDWDRNEVDLVLERDDGALVGIEVKARATVRQADFAGLHKLAKATGDRFAFGVVLYDGEAVVPFGERLVAAPISCLWSE